MSSKRLIAVVSCHTYVYPKHDEGGGHASGQNQTRATAIRETWYKDWLQYKDQIDLKFFYGAGATRCPEPDEVFLDCPDDYYSLPAKVQKIFDWALANGYDAVLKVDDDVFLYVSRLVSDFGNDDYRGYEVEAASGRYASGTAYWIDKRGMEIVVNTPWKSTDWAEDKWVGAVLLRNGIKVIHDERYHCCHCTDCLKTTPQSKRISSHTVDAKGMHELWRMTSFSERSNSQIPTTSSQS